MRVIIKYNLRDGKRHGMKKVQLLLFMLLLLINLYGCASDNGSEKKDELFISAATSLTDAMKEIAEIYEAENKVELTFNFAGSGKLAQQIQQGAPVDVFISANENWMDMLIEEELIKEETKEDITGNKLVLITRKDSSFLLDSFKELQANDIDQIAIGNPESVPAGEYTVAVLKNIDKWDELENKFVYAQDVRQ